MGGWKPDAVTTAEDVAVTALRALDMEDTLAPADTPIERTGGDFETEAAPPAAGEEVAPKALTGGRDGRDSVLVVDVPESGLYTVEAFGAAGEGQRWRADACRKVIVCAGAPTGWHTLMTQSFSAGRHTFAVTLPPDATVERVRLTRRKAEAADYVAALRRAGFDPGAGAVSRTTAVAALQFVRGLYSDRRQGRFCGDDIASPAPPAVPASSSLVAGQGIVGSTAPVVPPPLSVLSDALLPPQERASPVLPGPS
jgi:hypothetical protein